MTQPESTPIASRLQEALTENPDFLRELLERALQRLLEDEFTETLGAEPHQRIESRRGYRCGYYERSLVTRVGQLTLRVPRDRDGLFSTELFERYQRSEKALLLALIESYVCGVSTRKMKRITEDLCGVSVSKSTVSRLVQQLDEDLEGWRTRPLDRHYPYVYADGIYGKVRSEGRIRSEVALVVMGVDVKGRRQLLATDVVHEENQADYEALLNQLRERGLERIDLLVGDAHQGLQAAFARAFPGAGRQRCLVHLRRNLHQRVPVRHRQEMRGRLRVLLQAPVLPVAHRLFDELLDWTADWDSRLAAQLDEGRDELLAHMEFPQEHWPKIRSTNMLERVNEELRRRIRVARIFPNRASYLRLVTALAVEQDEEWQTDSRYLDVKLSENNEAVRQAS